LLDETGVTGELLSENGTAAQTAFTTATKTLNAYKYSSKQILTSYELFEDSLIDIESLVAKVAGTRLGRITETHMSTGTGSSQPTGIVVGANASTAVASATAITVANIMTLIGNVDPAHRASPKCAFMMNSTTMNQIASILDTAGRPILVSNYVDASGRLPTILGYPVVLNNNMASAAASTKPIIFGDLSAYTVRTVVGSGGLTLVRQNETYAALAQIGWVAFSRFDGCVLTGNTTTYNPIWSLLMAAGA
jgi:HK97 family phage major capsid protein